MDKTYKDILDDFLHLCESMARMTDVEWDDQIAAAVHAVFHQLFGPHPVPFMAGAPGKTRAHAAVQAAALPDWMQPLLQMLLQILLDRLLVRDAGPAS